MNDNPSTQPTDSEYAAAGVNAADSDSYDKSVSDAPDAPDADSAPNKDIVTDFVRAMRRFSMLNMRNAWSMVSHGRFVTIDIIKRLTAAEGASDGISVSAIAQCAHKPMPAISRDLGKLEADGLIERKSDPNDRRNTLVTLTGKGEETHEAIWAVYQEYIGVVINEMGEERTLSMIDDLNTWYDAMDKGFQTMAERHPELRNRRHGDRGPRRHRDPRDSRRHHDGRRGHGDLGDADGDAGWRGRA